MSNFGGMRLKKIQAMYKRRRENPSWRPHKIDQILMLEFHRKQKVSLTWCALQMRSRSWRLRNLDTTSAPKVKDTPRSFSPHPCTSLSGSDHNRSHKRPETTRHYSAITYYGGIFCVHLIKKLERTPGKIAQGGLLRDHPRVPTNGPCGCSELSRRSRQSTKKKKKRLLLLL